MSLGIPFRLVKVDAERYVEKMVPRFRCLSNRLHNLSSLGCGLKLMPTVWSCLCDRFVDFPFRYCAQVLPACHIRAGLISAVTRLPLWVLFPFPDRQDELSKQQEECGERDRQNWSQYVVHSGNPLWWFRAATSFKLAVQV